MPTLPNKERKWRQHPGTLPCPTCCEYYVHILLNIWWWRINTSTTYLKNIKVWCLWTGCMSTPLYVYVTHKQHVILVTQKSMMTIPIPPVKTTRWYAAIPTVVSVLLHIWTKENKKERNMMAKLCKKERKNYDDVEIHPLDPVRLLPLDACGLGLCPPSALVCDLLSRIGVYPVISWKVGPHRSGALCWWNWYRLLGSPSRIWIWSTRLKRTIHRVFSHV